MSDVEQAEEQVSTETPTEAVPETETPKGTEFTEFSNPDEEARFKRVYGHMKQYERQVGELSKMNANLLEKVESIETDMTEQKTGDRLTDLRTVEKAALEEGNIDAAQAARDKITELQVSSAKEPPKEEEKEQETPAWLTQDRQGKLVNWAYETGEDGSAVRPWADPKHPRHRSAMTVAAGLLEDISPGADEDEAMQQIFDQLDNFMGTDKPKASRKSAGVLDNSGGHRAPDKKDDSLTRDQKAIAAAMFPALAPEEANKRYAQAHKKYGAKNA